MWPLLGLSCGLCLAYPVASAYTRHLKAGNAHKKRFWGAVWRINDETRSKFAPRFVERLKGLQALCEGVGVDTRRKERGAHLLDC